MGNFMLSDDANDNSTLPVDDGNDNKNNGVDAIESSIQSFDNDIILSAPKLCPLADHIQYYEPLLKTHLPKQVNIEIIQYILDYVCGDLDIETSNNSQDMQKYLSYFDLPNITTMMSGEIDQTGYNNYMTRTNYHNVYIWSIIVLNEQNNITHLTEKDAIFVVNNMDVTKDIYSLWNADYKHTDHRPKESNSTAIYTGQIKTKLDNHPYLYFQIYYDKYHAGYMLINEYTFYIKLSASLKVFLEDTTVIKNMNGVSNSQ